MSTQHHQTAEQETLSHLANRLLAAEGGSVPLETLAMTAADEFGIDADIEQLVNERAGDVYGISRSDDNGKVITSVDPVGDEPDAVAAHFETADFADLNGVTEDIASVLQGLGYSSFEDLSEADPEALQKEIEQELEERADPIDYEALQDEIPAQWQAELENVDAILDALTHAGFSTYRDLAFTNTQDLADAADDHISQYLPPSPLSNLDSVSNTQRDRLQEECLESFRKIADAPIEELAEAGATINEARAEVIKEEAAEKAFCVDLEDADQISTAAEAFVTDVDAEQTSAIIAEATSAIPTAPRLIKQHKQRYKSRTNEAGSGTARVVDVDSVDADVPDPRYQAIAECDITDADSVYYSDIGQHADDPEQTGLPVNATDDHPSIPKPETHPDAGDDALPVADGEVIPPAVPVEPRLQVQMDVLIANKLARGLVPVCIEGPRGAGKNYLIKYLAYKTNNGYRSIDADRTTTPDDLFGPLTPDENGVIEPRSGPVKQALLNGEWLVINEFPTMRAGAAMAMHRLLNEGKLLIKSHGQLVEPHPQARIIVTMNPPTREYRDSEPMNSATRERFRRFQHQYPQDVKTETEAVARQANRNWQTASRETIRQLVEMAHKTRENESWPTVSTRSLMTVCEHIDDGASPRAAMKNVLWAVAEPNQNPDAAHQTLRNIVD